MKKTALLTWCFVFLASAWAQASIIDAPHNETNGIQCGSCHTYSLWWQYSPAKLSSSPNYDSVVNALCMACHDSQGPAPAVIGHGGAAMESTTYHNGLWTEGCTVCHNPHEQSQINWTQSNIDPYLVSGKIDGISADTPTVGLTTVTYSGATNNAHLSVWPTSSWNDKSLNNPGRGLIFVHDTVEAFNTFSVVSASATQIVVKGLISLSDISTTNCSQAPNCASANSFGLLYGQYVRNTISTPASGTRPVKFFDPKGGFVDTTSTPPSGVCQACHTLTHYWNNDGRNATHNNDTNCTACHFHRNGFKPIFPPHDAFVSKESTCTACHTGTDSVLDIHKGICSHCHTQPPTLANPATRPNVVAILAGSCFTCHGATFSHPNATHSNISGPNCTSCHNTASVINDVHKGNCLTCHTSTKTAVIDTITAGKLPGASVLCEDCHTGTPNGAPLHGTTPATAAIVHDQFSSSANCSSCHVIDTAEHRISLHPTCATCHSSTKSLVGATISTGISGSEVTCENCHDGSTNGASVHGTTATTVASLHDHFNTTTSCTSCHVGQTAEQRITLHPACTTCHGYGGGRLNLPPATVADAINSGRNGTDVECATCHTINHDTNIAHNNRVTTGLVLNCASCHDIGNQPAIDTLHNSCNTCHAYTGSKFNPTTVANAIVAGKGTTGVPINCEVCHGTSYGHPSATHSKIAGTNCAACHDTTNVINGIHLAQCATCHSSTKVSVINAITAGKLPDASVLCGNCHDGTDNGALAHGTTSATVAAVHNMFNTSANCSTCHIIDTAEHRISLHPACTTCHSSIKASVTTAIIAGSNGLPVTCENCHDGSINGAVAHGTTAASVASLHDLFNTTLSCASCHVAQTAEQRISLHPACTTCHSYSGGPLNLDPTTVADTITSGRNGTDVECATCHTTMHDTNVAHNNRVTTGLVLNCVNCHDIGTQSAIDTLHQDCGTCHGYNGTKFNPTTVANAIASGKGANGSPVNCETCHGTSYDHPSATHSKVLAVDTCVTCHAGATIITDIHKKNCVGCHSSIRPEVVQAISTRSGGTCKTCHTAAHPATVTIGSVHEVIATGDCSICHYPALGNSPHNNLASAAYCQNCHSGTTFVEIVAIHKNDCLKCHLSTDPTKSAAIAAGKIIPGTQATCETCHGVNFGHPNALHNNVQAAPECVVCHIGNSIIVDIHKNNCLNCHTSNRPEVRTAIDTRNGGTCTTCHVSAHKSVPDVGTLHLLSYTTCTECHYPNLTVKPHNNLSTVADCSGCHSGTAFTALLSIHQNNCLKCHLSGMSEIIGIIDAGRTNPGTPQNCKSCHTGASGAAPVHGTTASTAASVHDRFAGSISCGSCHVVGTAAQRISLHPACTTCHSSTLSAVTAAITAGRSGTSVNCETCHTGTTTGAVVHGVTTPPEHTTFASSPICGSCHVSGTWQQRLSLHPDCFVCHNSTLSAVTATITAGKAGTTVSCENCHTGTTTGAPLHGTTVATVAPQHDMFAGSPGCSACHSSTTAEQRISLHPACTTCHSSALSTVSAAIAAGRAGTPLNCVTCHSGNTTGAPIHGTSIATVAPQHDKFVASTTCGACHTSATAEQRLTLHQACTTCHSSTLSAVTTTITAGRNGTSVSCENCHTGTTTGPPVHGSTASTVAPQHDKFAASTTCNACHTSTTAEQRLTLHQLCTTCHSSTLTTVTATIAAGRTGTTVSCENCHTGTTTGALVHGTTPATVATVHNKFIDSTTCSSCHITNTAEQRINLHSSCSTCHSSNQSTVQYTIASGRAGTSVTCGNCHDGTVNGAPGHGTTPATAATAHNMFVATPACAACHPNGSAEQRISLHKSCSTCHNSTKQTVINAIASGRAGSAVQCISCHSGDLGVTHHANANAASGNCTWCHADPRFDWTTSRPGDNGGSSGLPTQLPCAQCHVRVSGTTIYIDKIVYANNNYSVPPTRTVQHTINGVTSGSIYNYGICFSCHNGTKATAVGLYHAKPASASTSSRYTKMLYSPGRGTFNLFWSSWHGRKESSFGSENNQSNQYKHQNPTINFSMIAVPCASFNGCSGATTSTVPILPAKPVPTPAGTAVHNNFSTTTSCSTCHSSSSEVARTVGLHSACANCHTSTLPSVITTILGGINGTAINCQNCHDGSTNGAPSHGTTATEVAAAHNKLSTYATCANCHTLGNQTFTDIYTLHQSNCMKCHASSDSAVQATITAGKNGTAVNCTNCHGTSHHESPQAKAGNCTWCHSDPRDSWTTMRPGDNGSSATFPTQMACKTCHVRVSGSTIYIDKIRYTSYSSTPTRTVQHTLAGITAGTINNYGICMSCHNGVKAVRVDLFHAKPNSPASSNRYSNMSTAPGRGTFNLFWSQWHGNKNANFGNKNNESNMNRFQNPSVTFKKIAVPCANFNGCSGSTTLQVPVLPAVANATSGGSSGTGGTGVPTGNQTPFAQNDTFTVNRNSSNNTFTVLANDSDPDGDTLTISAVGARSKGGAVTNKTTSLSYTPAHYFTGTETFTYTIRDPGGLTSTATVTVTVNH